MPKCPEDSVELVLFSSDISSGGVSFYECPAHGGRYVYGTRPLRAEATVSGMKHLIAVPKAAVSKPTSGFKQIYNVYTDPVTNELVVISEDGERKYGGGAGDMTYIELNAAGLSAGNNNLTSSSWAVSKAQVDYIKVTVTAGAVTNFDIAVYEKDTFQAADIRYSAAGLNSTDNWEDDIEWAYVDDDNTNEVHLKITENAGGPGTYSVQLRGIKLI